MELWKDQVSPRYNLSDGKTPRFSLKLRCHIFSTSRGLKLEIPSKNSIQTLKQTIKPSNNISALHRFRDSVTCRTEDAKVFWTTWDPMSSDSAWLVGPQRNHGSCIAFSHLRCVSGWHAKAGLIDRLRKKAPRVEGFELQVSSIDDPNVAQCINNQQNC